MEQKSIIKVYAVGKYALFSEPFYKKVCSIPLKNKSFFMRDIELPAFISNILNYFKNIFQFKNILS